MIKKIIYGIIALIILGCIAWGPIVSYMVEQPKYTIIDLNDGINHDDIEIREYAPMIIAEVSVSGERSQAIGQGFRKIADYIFGNNSLNKDVAMTAPVIQQEGTEIAMTAPVIQQQNNIEDSWKVRFVMPSKYTMESLPKPINKEIKLIEIPAKRFAVIGFSGRASEEDLLKQTKRLQAYMGSKNLKAIAKPQYAFFNPPWTLSFLRHNEVMIELEGKNAK